MNQQASTQDLSESKYSQQSIEPPFQLELTHSSASPLRKIDELISVQTQRTPIKNEIWCGNVFKDVLNKKKLELQKMNKSQFVFETPKQVETSLFEFKTIKQQDKIIENINKAGQRSGKKQIKQKPLAKSVISLQYYVPIQDRYQDIIDKKEEWVKQQQEIKEKIKKQEEEDCLQETMNKSLNISQINPEEFYSSQMSWLEKRNDFIYSEQVKKLNESLEQLTFRPNLGNNNKKQKIIQNSAPQQKNKKQQSSPIKPRVEDRLLDYLSVKQENLLKLEDKYLPTFKPNSKPDDLFQ